MEKTSTGRESKGRTGVTPAKGRDRIQDDPVSHTSHYASDGQFSFPDPECIMLTRLLDFNAGNAVKYIWRAGFKGSVAEDLRKALWYMDDAIKKDWRRRKCTTSTSIALTLVKMLRPASDNAFAEKKLTAIQFLCAGFPSYAKHLVEKMIKEVE